MTINTGNFGTSIGQMAGLGLTVGFGAKALGLMVDVSKKLKPKHRKAKPKKKKKPKKGTGLFPALNFKPTGNFFYPVNWAKG